MRCVILVGMMAVTTLAGEPVRQGAEFKHFAAIEFIQTGRHPSDVQPCLMSIDIDGPISEKTRPLPKRLRHIVQGATGKDHYGIDNHGFFRIDLEGGKCVDLVPPAGIGELSWTCGIAYDSKRERIVIATLGGVGHLYSYDPKSDKWAVINGLDNVDLLGLTYDRKSDLLYGLHTEYPDKRGRLTAYDPAGKKVSFMKLEDPVAPSDLNRRPNEIPPQMGVIDGELLIALPDRHIAFDLKNSKVRVTWPRK